MSWILGDGKERKKKAYLLIEHPIPLIDIRDIALVFVEPFAPAATAAMQSYINNSRNLRYGMGSSVAVSYQGREVYASGSIATAAQGVS